MAVVALSRPHRADVVRRGTVSRPHLALVGRRGSLSRPHIADADQIARLSRPHVALSGRTVALERPHVADVEQASPPLYVIKVGASIGVPEIPVGPIPGLLNPGLAAGFYRPWVRVGGPSGDPDDVQELDWTQEINAGWKATLTYRGLHSLDFAEEAPFRITVSDGAGSTRELPVMIAEKRSRKESMSGPTTVFELVDRASWRLSRGGRDLPTFVRSSGSEIAAAVGRAWDVPVLSAPGFPVIEEDIADSDGWAPLLRLASVSASNLLVGVDGRLQYVDNRHVGGSLAMKVSEIEESHTPSLIYSGMSVVKTSSLPQGGQQVYQFDRAGFASFALRSPLRAIIPLDRSTSGGLGYLALWAGPPEHPDSRLVAFHLLGRNATNLRVPILPGGIVTNATVAIYPPSRGTTVRATLILSGSAPEAPHPGTDAAFALSHGGGRNLTQWQEQLLPSRAYVAARLPRYLWEASKRGRTLSYSGRMDLRMAPTWSLERPGYPANRAESVTHRIGVSGIPTTSVEAVLL